MSALLLGLPLARWAKRFDRGTVSVRGHLADGEPAHLAFTWAGGHVLGDLAAAQDLVERLHDPVVAVCAETDPGLLVKVLPGFTARLSPGARVQAEAIARGSPEEPRLAGPFAIRVSGDGVRVGLFGATLIVSSGAMSPDGEVTLRGRGWLARSVLGLAARQLTREIRRGARFARVRAFLRATAG